MKQKMEDKRILVTGGSGFIPSHLVKRLISQGAEVAIITKYNSVFDNIRLADVWNKVKIIEADIRNQDSLKQIKKFEPQIVYHMAAYNHVGDSFTHVSESFDVNAKGTANVIDAYDDYEKFIYISTSEIYGFQEKVPWAEDFNPSPLSPYSVGKYAGELYCRMKIKMNNSPISIIRPFNAFGPYQSSRAVIPEIINNCLLGKDVLATWGKQTRDFNYVTNLIDGLVLAAEKKSALGQIINLGSDEEIPIKDLILKIHQLTNSKSKLRMGDLEYRPTEIWRMRASNQKAKELLGWTPKINFENGLIKTIEWFKKYKNLFEDDNSSLFRLNKDAYS